MIVGEILINPNFALTLIVKTDKSVINSHWTTFFIGGFKSFERSVKDIEGLRIGELWSIN